MVAEANGGATLFHDDDDYVAYLSLLRQMSRDRLFKVFAYCLTPTEIRLVVMPMRLMLSRIIQRLHGKHTARMNSKLDRKGHLFRGRFRSIIFDQAHLLEVVRSVHLWPVRVLQYRRPELYLFSSHAAYLGVNTADRDVLSMNEVMDQFPGNRESQIRAFTRFVELKALDADDFGVDEITFGIGGDTRSSQTLLKKAGVHEISQKKRSSILALAERVSLMLGISLEQMLANTRRQDLVMARRLLATAAVLGADRRVTEVADFLNRDKAQVSRLVTQGMDMLHNHEPFLMMFEALKVKGGRMVMGKHS